MRTAFLCVPLTLVAACATVPSIGSRDTVLAVDDQQRAMVAASDVAGLERLAHPNLRINAPGGRVIRREQFLANMRSGEIAAEAFERTAEDVSISGNVAAVMGRETFTPRASSELGRAFGARPLQRRYTNIYLWQQGQWLWLARHANVLPASGSPPVSSDAAPEHPPNMHVGVPGRCEEKAKNGGGAEGCFWNAC